MAIFQLHHVSYYSSHCIFHYSGGDVGDSIVCADSMNGWVAVLTQFHIIYLLQYDPSEEILVSRESGRYNDSAEIFGNLEKTVDTGNTCSNISSGV